MKEQNEELRLLIEDLGVLKKVADLCAKSFEEGGNPQKAEHWVGQSNGLMKAKLLVRELLLIGK